MTEGAAIWLAPEILTALIAAGAAVLLGLSNLYYGRRHTAELERLKHELATRSKHDDARIDYEYKARIRLYEACGPIMFQLTTSAERARGRIVSFALAHREGNIGGADTWLDPQRYGYYWASSFYRLLVPAAIAELLKRRLTHLDLSLDAHLHAQFELSLAWADCFSQDFTLSRTDPALPYDPHGSTADLRRTDPARYWQQGIPRGILESAAASLIVGEGAEATIMPYGQFEALLLSEDPSDTRAAFERIAYLLRDFGPARRPVLWRLLCAQFGFAVALIELKNHDSTLARAAARVAEIDPLTLDWSRPTDPDTARTDAATAMAIGLGFAKRTLADISNRLQTAGAT